MPQFLARGSLEMKTATVERRGKASFVTLRHPRFLNAEDELTIDEMETAIDLATLDPETAIAVFRGDAVEHPKYKGRRIFCSGINLTHLYHGKIGFLWYMRRDMGAVNKIFRGVAKRELSPDDISGPSTEKPWVAAVDTFAIGGGCQYLLTMDYVLAASDAYMTLPARKEGIIPGAANLRLPRFVGDRIARQAIMYGRRLDCDSARRPAHLRRGGAARRDGRRARSRDRANSRVPASSAPPATAAPSASARSRSISSAAIWRSMRASRRTAISARR